MMDFATIKAITIPEGNVESITCGGVVLWQKPASYTNQIPISINADGSIYNGSGYQNSTRINSSGNVVVGTTNAVFTTGFIPIELGDVIRLNGNYIHPTYAYNGAGELWGSSNSGIYDSSFTKIAVANMKAAYTQSGMFINPVYNDDGYIIQATLNTNWSYTKGKTGLYYRATLAGSGEGAVLTVNEEIT